MSVNDLAKPVPDKMYARIVVGLFLLLVFLLLLGIAFAVNYVLSVAIVV